MEVLSMRDVCLSFGQTQALQNLTFSVQEGEIFGFLGPSGAGKTTTIKLLTRQLTAHAGQIALFDVPIENVKNDVYEQIGILSDNSGVYERMTVYENLKLFAQLKGLSLSRIDDVLEQVDMADAKKTIAKKLSKGMRQRLILAMAVLHSPKLLFLDEPTAALDPATTRAIHKLLRGMNQNGTTIFLTTHDMEEADRLCSRVAFLNHGQVEESGAPAQLKLKYAADTVHVTLENGQKLTTAKDPAALCEMFAALQGRVISTVHSEEPNLEEIFLQVTGRTLV